MNNTLSILVLISASLSFGSWFKMQSAALDGTNLIEQTRSAQVRTQERNSISKEAHHSQSIYSSPEAASLLARLNCSAFAFHPNALAWGPYAVLRCALLFFQVLELVVKISAYFYLYQETDNIEI